MQQELTRVAACRSIDPSGTGRKPRSKRAHAGSKPELVGGDAARRRPSCRSLQARQREGVPTLHSFKVKADGGALRSTCSVKKGVRAFGGYVLGETYDATAARRRSIRGSCASCSEGALLSLERREEGVGVRARRAGGALRDRARAARPAAPPGHAGGGPFQRAVASAIASTRRTWPSSSSRMHELPQRGAGQAAVRGARSAQVPEDGRGAVPPARAELGSVNKTTLGERTRGCSGHGPRACWSRTPPTARTTCSCSRSTPASRWAARASRCSARTVWRCERDHRRRRPRAASRRSRATSSARRRRVAVRGADRGGDIVVPALYEPRRPRARHCRASTSAASPSDASAKGADGVSCSPTAASTARATSPRWHLIVQDRRLDAGPEGRAARGRHHRRARPRPCAREPEAERDRASRSCATRRGDVADRRRTRSTSTSSRTASRRTCSARRRCKSREFLPDRMKIAARAVGGESGGLGAARRI